MSRFFVLVRPALAPGFRLAGVETFEAYDAEEAAEHLRGWLDAGERGLLAIDDGLLENFDPALLQRLRASDRLLNITIPGGSPLQSAAERQERLARLIHRAVGVQIAFGGAGTPEGESE